MPAVKFGFFADPDRTRQLAELFSRASDAAVLAPPGETWLVSGGLTLFARPPGGTAFERVGYHKAAFSGLRVVGISIKNDASHIDDTLQSMKAFARYTQSMQLIEGDAVSPAILPKTRAIDGESLTALMAALGART